MASKRGTARYRVFRFAQFEVNPDTGASLNFSEVSIIQGLAHKVIKRWAYIKHDKDVYTKEEEEESRTGLQRIPKHRAGDPKGEHWHVVIELPGNAMEPAKIAKWFGVPENMVNGVKGRGGFLDYVEYLVHETEKAREEGKYHYSDDAVKANFPWREELTKQTTLKTKYGRMLDTKERFRYEVLMMGKTLLNCKLEDPLNYAADMATLKRLRLEYLVTQKPPKLRMNFYVCGDGRDGKDDKKLARGGVGKGMMTRTLALSLYPEIEHEDEIYFRVGGKGVAFDGYDGQPVIIWNDRRSYDLVEELGGRGAVFDVFDTHPDTVAARRNIKYGSVVLTHAVNIVDGIEGYEIFLGGLVGDYTDRGGIRHTVEDKTQSYRRFPFIIPVHEKDFDMLINKGFMADRQDLCDQYEAYKTVRGNMQMIAAICGANERMARAIQSKMVAPITAKCREICAAKERQQMDDDALLIKFADVGTSVTDAEAEELRSMKAAELGELRATERAEAELEAMEVAEEEALEAEIEAYLARQSQAVSGDDEAP